jgi:hypothetical protein
MDLRKFIFFLLIVFSSGHLRAQLFLESKGSSISASFGLGKAQYFSNHTLVYLLAADDEAIKYSDSWSFSYDRIFFLTPHLDFSIGLSHLTIRERTRNTALPSWFIFSDKKLSQGFFHVVSGINIRLADDRFSPYLGLRSGIANFISKRHASEASNAFADLDFAADVGISIKMIEHLKFNLKLIYGLTRYDYSITQPVVSHDYFKYHSFQLGLSYAYQSKKN